MIKVKDETVKGVVIKLFCFVACNPTVCFVGLTDCGSRVFSLFLANLIHVIVLPRVHV